MTLLEYLLGMILVGGVLFLIISFVFGRGESLAPVPPDAVPVELPDDRLAGPDDLRALRLPVVLRGYRMHEVDWVLDRLAGELAARDAELETLRARLDGQDVEEDEDEEEPPIWAAKANSAGAGDSDD